MDFSGTGAYSGRISVDVIRRLPSACCETVAPNIAHVAQGTTSMQPAVSNWNNALVREATLRIRSVVDISRREAHGLLIC